MTTGEGCKIKLSEAEVGRKVIYIPFEECDNSQKEYGVITGKNNWFVFVRYSTNINSKATRPEDLNYL